MFNMLGAWLHDVFVTRMNYWVLVGYCGQFLFTMRLVMQWLASERAKRSVVPITFWFFSIAGGLILFVYAIGQKEPVFILGQGAGILIYIRNLWFILKENKKTKSSSSN